MLRGVEKEQVCRPDPAGSDWGLLALQGVPWGASQKRAESAELPLCYSGTFARIGGTSVLGFK